MGCKAQLTNILVVVLILIISFGCIFLTNKKGANTRFLNNTSFHPIFIEKDVELYANKPTKEVLTNPIVDAVILSVRWRNIEKNENEYDWSALDKKIALVKSHNKKIILNVMTCGVNVPQWIMSKHVVTFSFTASNPNQPIYGKTFTVPVYWDDTYLNYKKKFIEALGKRYGNDSSIIGVMVSFVSTINNDWYIPKNTTPNLLDVGYDNNKLLEVGKETIDWWAEAFPNAMLKLPVGVSLQYDGITQTDLAENIIEYAYNKYPTRFYAQVNALSPALPTVNEIQNINKGEKFYILKILSRHPGKIGFQMLSDVTTNHGRLSTDSCKEPLCILNNSIRIALTYKPRFIEVSYKDIENKNLFSIWKSLTIPPSNISQKTYNNDILFFDFHYKLQKKNPTLFSDHELIDVVILEVPWSIVEPQEGIFNFTELDDVIDTWNKHGKHVMLRVIPYGQSCGNVVTPEWVYDRVDAISFFSKKRGEVRIPKVWSQEFLSIYKEYINALAKHYDKDKRVQYIEVGIGHIGYTSAQPSKEGTRAFIENGWNIDEWEEYIKWVLDEYRDSFKNKTLVLGISPILLRGHGLKEHLDFGKEIVSYAVDRGYVILFKGVSENKMELENTGFIPLIEYISTLQANTTIGFGDDWPLLGPTGSGYRDEDDFKAIIQTTLDIWNNVLKRKHPIFLVLLSNEMDASYKKGQHFNPIIYNELCVFKKNLSLYQR